MATSQKLVNPYPVDAHAAIEVPISYRWQKSYRAALQETDGTKMPVRVQTAESEIHQRRLELSQDHSGTQEERDALVNAMGGLRVLRMNVASRLEWQNQDSGMIRKPAQPEPHSFRPSFRPSPDKAS
jgi:hypothetical protein